MKKIDFRKIEIYTSFENEEADKKRVVDVSKDLGNLMKYESSVIDIAFEDLAKGIYYKGEVEVPTEWVEVIKQTVMISTFKAPIKRAILEKFEEK